MTTALNLMRKDLKRPRDADLSRSAPPAVSDRYETDLLDVLRELPHRQRAAVLLYYVADMPVREVADAMGVAEGTVKALLAQARDKLRTTLGGRVER
jgi:RNA polymerase sigma-70 factor, ECF subfamily